MDKNAWGKGPRAIVNFNLLTGTTHFMKINPSHCSRWYTSENFRKTQSTLTSSCLTEGIGWRKKKYITNIFFRPKKLKDESYERLKRRITSPLTSVASRNKALKSRRTY